MREGSESGEHTLPQVGLRNSSALFLCGRGEGGLGGGGGMNKVEHR
jgi:hypothetical protein